tara:strand:- start:764 stop:1783 length:1020 start_codon:yes stop_codon:yes gene_type:complete
MANKKAFITGISGQDGAYLAMHLLKKGYEVIGGGRNIQGDSIWRLKELGLLSQIKIIPFELLDEKQINNAIVNGKFSEIYNLAAKSFVGHSYDTPLATSNINALGVVRILEAIRKYSNTTKLYQASSSEMYGNSKTKKKNENTIFNPTSPYAISKLYAHWMIKLYREAYDIFCCSGILFNHESPLRGDEFVTKKIILDLAKVKYNIKKSVKLGNIYIKRDWGYSKDYVEAMWKILQQRKPDDFVVSSGKTLTVKSLVNKAAKYFGYDLIWKGKGIKEKAFDKKTKKLIVEIDEKFFRPTEVDYLYGDSTKARKILKWQPKTDVNKLIKIMCDYEIKKYK